MEEPSEFPTTPPAESNADPVVHEQEFQNMEVQDTAKATSSLEAAAEDPTEGALDAEGPPEGKNNFDETAIVEEAVAVPVELDDVRASEVGMPEGLASGVSGSAGADDLVVEMAESEGVGNYSTTPATALTKGVDEVALDASRTPEEVLAPEAGWSDAAKPPPVPDVRTSCEESEPTPETVGDAAAADPGNGAPQEAAAVDNAPPLSGADGVATADPLEAAAGQMSVEEQQPALPVAKEAVQSGFPDKAPPADKPSSNAPLEERLVDRSWKTRKEAIEEAVRKLSLEEDYFEALAPLMPKLVNESNASCLAAAVDLALSFAGGPDSSIASRVCEDTVAQLVEKGFNGRPKVAETSQGAILKFMEVDVPGPAIGILLNGFGNRKPKIPPLCLDTVAKAIEAFGVSDVPVADVLKAIKPLFTSSKGPVRDGAVKVASEVGKFTGMAILEPVVEGLRDTQKQEIQKSVQEGTSGPTIGLRKYRQSGDVAQTSEDGACETKASAPPQMNPRDFAPEVDLLNALRQTEFRSRIGEAKWSEKVAAMNIAIAAIGSIPKLKPDDYGDFVDQISTLVGHSHFQVSGTAVKLLSLLAEGLGEPFRAFVPKTVRLFIQTLNNKKVLNTAKQAFLKLYLDSAALDSFAVVLEEVKGAFVGNKQLSAVHGREAMFQILSSCFAEAEPNVPKNETGETVEELASVAISHLSDRDPKIREGATALLCSLVRPNPRLGQGPRLRRQIDALQNEFSRVHKRLSEAASSGAPAQSTAPTKLPPKSPPKSRTGPADKREANAVEAKAPKGEAIEVDLSDAFGAPAKPKKQPPARFRRPSSSRPTRTDASKPSRTQNSAGTGAASSAKANTSKGPETDMEEDENISLSVPEAEGVISEALGSAVWEEISGSEGLGSAKWQQRKAALETLANALASEEVQVSALLSAITVYVSSKTRNLKESNFNVMKEVLSLFSVAMEQLVAEAAQSDVISQLGRVKSAVAPVVKVSVEKLSDRKLSETAKTFLMGTAEVITPKYVALKSLKGLNDARAPLAKIAILKLLQEVVEGFGASSLGASSLSSLAQGAVVEAANSNVKVRNAASELLGALYAQVGPPLRSLTLAPTVSYPSAVTASTKTSIENLFDGITPDANYQPTKSVKLVDGGGSGAGENDGGGAISVPRTDLVAALGKEAVANLTATSGKNAWKQRLASIEGIVSSVTDCGFYIECNRDLAELLRGLKGRLNDTQANLKPKAALAIACIIRAVDADAAPRIFKVVAEPLVGGAGDNKKMMQKASIDAISQIATLNAAPDPSQVKALPSMSQALLPALSATLCRMTTSRVELLKFSTEYEVYKPLHLADDDTKQAAVKSLTDCMTDRSAEVRKLAGAALKVAAMGFLMPGGASFEELKNIVDRNIRDKSPAVKETLSIIVRRSFSAAEEQMQNGLVDEVHVEESKRSTSINNENHVSTSSAKQEQPEAADRTSLQENGERRRGRKGLSRSHRSDEGMSKEEDRAQSKPDAAAQERSAGNPEPSGSHATALFKLTGKTRRMDSYARNEWRKPPEDLGVAENEELRSEWLKFLSADMTKALFPGRVGSMECGERGVAAFSAILENPEYDDIVLEHLDLIFKWITLRLCEREHPRALVNLMSFICSLFEKLNAMSYSLAEPEQKIVVPWLLEKAGFAKERFRKQMKQVTYVLSTSLMPTTTYCTFVCESLQSRNVRSRMFALDELRRLTEADPVSGPLTLKRAAAKQVGKLIDARETEVRHGALAVAAAVFSKVGDYNKVVRLLGGENLSETAKGLLKEKIRRIEAHAGDSEARASDASKLAKVSSMRSSKSADHASANQPKSTAAPDSRSLEQDFQFEMDLDTSALLSHQKDVSMVAESGLFNFEIDPSEVVSTQHEAQEAPSAAPARSTSMEIENRESTVENFNVGASRRRLSGSVQESTVQGHFATSFELLDALLQKAESLGTISEEDLAYFDAKQVIKRFHQLSHGETDDMLPSISEMRMHFPDFANDIAVRLANIVRCSMCILPDSAWEMDLAVGGGIDVGLLSVSLAAFGALLDSPRFSVKLSGISVALVLETLYDGYFDKRLVNPPDALSEVNYGSLRRALGRLAFTLIDTSDRTAALCALIELFGSSPTSEFREKLLSLLKRFFRTEMRVGSPAGSLASISLSGTFGTMDRYFAKFLEAPPGVDDPVRQVLALLHRMRGPVELSRVLHVVQIGEDSVLMRICDEFMERRPTSADYASIVDPEGPSSPGEIIPVETRESLHLKQMADIVGRLGQGAEQDEVAIRELYCLQVEFPDLDISSNIKNLSARFQVYILGKLDELRDRYGGKKPVPDAAPEVVPSISEPDAAMATVPSGIVEALPSPGTVSDADPNALHASPRIGAAARANKMSELRKRLNNLSSSGSGTAPAAEGKAPTGTSASSPTPANTLGSLTNIKSRLSRMQSDVASKSSIPAPSTTRVQRGDKTAEENDPNLEKMGDAVAEPPASAADGGQPVLDLKTRLARLKESRRMG